MGAADRAETGVPAEGLVGAEAPKGRAELGPCPGPPPTRGPPLVGVVEGEKEDGPGFVVIGVEGELLPLLEGRGPDFTAELGLL